ncbi:MAG: MBL fold metallo-hydrolase, partial [Dehalococcoidia bacterium]|nr:MBL fold metallo-hydrolase [Dehalococcoidia bacterium]
HIAGNAYFPGVEVIGQRGMLPRYEEMVPRMTGEERRKQLEEQDPDSSWLIAHPAYPPNPPTRLFDDQLTLTLGGQSIEVIHHPGHTPPQTSVWLPGEGVIFTGDNVFHHVKTFIQEADPWLWLESLDAIRALDPAIIVPGHGEPCTTDYLAEQAEIIEAWVDAVTGMVRQGVTQEEARAQRPATDPYRIGQRLFPIEDGLNTRIIDNLYPRIVERLKA